ncbi:MAG TPA: pyruvate dehydrogenase complex dihydrolipoamide acetyltransferase, partial [Brevundimonas sp.]|nr:pyruvate dehydrogenase complex dihydrolipoamide acetyltransferase [Brevundimonas sp.]
KVNTPIARLAGDDAAPAPKKPETAKEDAKAGPKPEPAAEKAEATKAPPAPAKDGERIFASPLARRLAKDAGLDLKTLKGTGPHGRIVKADVESAGKGGTAKSTTAAATAGEPRKVQSLAQMGIPDGSYDLIPLDGMRKAIARRLTDSFRDVPHFPLTIDCEIDGLLAARAQVNALLEPQGIKVSVNDFIMKAVAMALKAVPEANASYSPEGIAMHHHADVAMAVAIDGGLITPIIRAAETKSLAEIATESKDLA